MCEFKWVHVEIEFIQTCLISVYKFYIVVINGIVELLGHFRRTLNPSERCCLLVKSFPILVYVVAALNLDEVYGFHDWVPCSQQLGQHMEYLKVPALR